MAWLPLLQYSHCPALGVDVEDAPELVEVFDEEFEEDLQSEA
jgi:hypothetical protein